MANEVIEAARLLRELQQEALNSITHTVTPKENIIKFSGFSYTSPFAISRASTVTWRIQMKVNDLEVDLKGEVAVSPSIDTKQIAEVIWNDVRNAVEFEIKSCLLPVFNSIR